MSTRLLWTALLVTAIAGQSRADVPAGPRGCVPPEVTRTLQSYFDQSRQQSERLQRLYKSMAARGKDDLHALLESEDQEQRLMAAYVGGDRGLPWFKEFLAMLTDPVDVVRQSARRGLIILSFLALNPDEVSAVDPAGKTRQPSAVVDQNLCAPVDFGPPSGASLSAQRKAITQWIEWWAESRPVLGRGNGQQRFPSEFDADIELRHLAMPFLKADADRRKELAAFYRDAEGSGYSEALAVAIAQSSEDARDELREALATRMSRVTDETLRRRLDDRLPEVRRAALLELVRRENKAHVSRMTELLLDTEPAVWQAAHAGLCQLSGQDFGPKADATRDERAQAVSRWEKWWRSKGTSAK
jgi:hypothetical protein